MFLTLNYFRFLINIKTNNLYYLKNLKLLTFNTMLLFEYAYMILISESNFSMSENRFEF